MKKSILLFLALMLLSYYLNAQNVGINTDGSSPSADAGLDVKFTNKGVLIPRVSIGNLANISPIAGGSTESLLVYNTNTSTGKGYYYWDGSKWIRIYDDNSGKEWKIAGNAGLNGSNKLGTTDNVAVNLTTNNTTRFIVSSSNPQIQANGNGTASAPNYGWNSVTNMGMFKSASNSIGFSTGGTERFRIPNANQVHAMSDGTATSPFYSWSSDPNMGIFRAGTDILAFSTNGSERMRINASGQIMINTTTLTDPNQFELVSSNNYWGVSAYHNGTGGGSGFFSNTSNSNGYSALEAITNYSGLASPAAVNGIAINTSLSHRAIGVKGAANGRDGIGIMGSIQTPQNPTVRAYGWAGYFSGDVFSSTGLYGPSDSRLKTDIKPFIGGLKTLKEINIVSYNYDVKKYPNAGFSTDNQVGIIAQELKEILPSAVAEKLIAFNATSEVKPKQKNELDFQKFYTVDYTKLIPIVVEAIQEQQTIIESQKSEIDELRERLERLEQLIQD